MVFFSASENSLCTSASATISFFISYIFATQFYLFSFYLSTFRSIGTCDTFRSIGTCDLKNNFIFFSKCCFPSFQILLVYKKYPSYCLRGVNISFNTSMSLFKIRCLQMHYRCSNGETRLYKATVTNATTTPFTILKGSVMNNTKVNVSFTNGKMAVPIPTITSIGKP